MPSGTVLAFDFGIKKIGVAVGQNVTGQATPLCILKAVNGQPNWQYLQSLVDEWLPSALVVGLPLNLDGSMQSIAEQAKGFAKQLKKRFTLAVALVDETLTTKAARIELKEQEQYQQASELVDSYAAKLIFESWWREQHEHTQ